MGDSFPTGPSPEYPPDRWKCPSELGGCGKEHSKPHYEWPGQVDRSLTPGTEGRVKFNRIGKNEALDIITPVKKRLLDKQAPGQDETGNPKPLFCPHCGYTHEGILLIKMGR